MSCAGAPIAARIASRIAAAAVGPSSRIAAAAVGPSAQIASAAVAPAAAGAVVVDGLGAGDGPLLSLKDSLILKCTL